ncbi:MAG: M20/M25/M40 family metallo-hydrolase [Eubacterium sp.]|nr:M20/M25/M40 family metallo-hydrolase [Candidatus Colimonas fimequi]
MTIDALKLTNEFVEITKIDRETYNEREMVDYIKARLDGMGFQVEEDNAGDTFGGNAGNVYAFLPGDLPGEPILFSCHLDTVVPGNGKVAIVEGDIIKSDGTTVLGGDDLTGILPIIYGIEWAIASGEPRRDIEILFTVAEEVFTYGAKAFDYNKLRAKSGYVFDMDGAAGQAAISAPSIIQAKATVHGRAAHAGFACEDGINAIAAVTKAVSQMVQGRPDPDSTFNVGTIEGGVATNIVSEKCTIKCETRGFSHARCEELIENARILLQKAADEVGGTLDFETKAAVKTYSISENETVVGRFVKACEAVGMKSELVRTFGVSDANYYAELGINCLVISTGMSNVHSTNEYCSISRMVKNAELVAKLVTQ